VGWEGGRVETQAKRQYVSKPYSYNTKLCFWVISQCFNFVEKSYPFLYRTYKFWNIGTVIASYTYCFGLMVVIVSWVVMTLRT
jgi:hypothetical protein